MRPEVFEIHLDSPTAQYVAGSAVIGELVVSVKTAVKLSSISVCLFGSLHTHWVNKVSDKIYETEATLINESASLIGYLSQVSDGELLPQGSHRVGFRFQLPRSLPSSVFHESFGGIVYTCTASVRASPPPPLPSLPRLQVIVASDSCIPGFTGSRELSTNRSIQLGLRPRRSGAEFQGVGRVLAYVHLDDYPLSRQPATKQESVEQVGCCRAQGTVSATMSVKRSGFLIGDRLPIELAWKDSSNKRLSKAPSVTLVQQLHFRAANRYEPILSDEKEAMVAVASVPIDAAPDAAAIPKSFKGQLYLGPLLLLACRQEGGGRGRRSADVPGDLPPSSASSGDVVVVAYFLRLDTNAFELAVPIVLGSSASPDFA